MELIKLDEFEVFQVVERFVHEAVERDFDCSMPAIDKLPKRNAESRTAKAMLEALAMRKLAKYESAITEAYDLRNETARRLGEAFKPPYLADPPQALKRRIADLDRRIASLIEEAHRFAIRFAWTLKGGFEPDTREYKFVVSKNFEVFQRRAA